MPAQLREEMTQVVINYVIDLMETRILIPMTSIVDKEMKLCIFRGDLVYHQFGNGIPGHTARAPQ